MKLIYIVFLTISLAFSQNLKHDISKEESFVVSFSSLKDGDFSFKEYEVYAPQSKVAFAKGKTDALSRVLFLPNKKGIWRVKVFSQDGHETIVNIEVSQQLQTAKEDEDDDLWFIEELIGFLILFVIFGFIYLRKDKEEPKV